jgi:hypothetical protein
MSPCASRVHCRRCGPAFRERIGVKVCPLTTGRKKEPEQGVKDGGANAEYSPEFCATMLAQCDGMLAMPGVCRKRWEAKRDYWREKLAAVTAEVAVDGQ